MPTPMVQAKQECGGSVDGGNIPLLVDCCIDNFPTRVWSWAVEAVEAIVVMLSLAYGFDQYGCSNNLATIRALLTHAPTPENFLSRYWECVAYLLLLLITGVADQQPTQYKQMNI